MFGKRKKLEKRIDELGSRLRNVEDKSSFNKANLRTHARHDRTAICTRCNKTDFVANMVKHEEAVLEEGCFYISMVGPHGRTPPKAHVETTYTHKSCRKPAVKKVEK